MIKKTAISLLVVLLLIAPATQAQDVPKVSKFSYSDDLKAGDKFAWEVSSTYSVQDPLLKDGSVIEMEVLQDLAGHDFSGDLESNELSDYFNLDFGESQFVSGEEAIHIVVFPDSVTLDNGTTLNPLQGFWVDVLIDQVDIPDGVVSDVTVDQTGDFLTVGAKIKYTVQGFALESTILAKLNTKLGITEEYNLDLKTNLATQTLDVVRVEVTEESSSTSSAKTDTSESDDAALPFNFAWMILPVLILPILRKFK